MIDIQPASIGQIQRARNGRMVFIDQDVQNVAQDLRDISPDLRLAYNELEDFFVVYQVVQEPDGSETEKIVTTAQDLDQRIVHRVRQIAHPSYNYAAELERKDAQADRDRDHRFNEMMGPKAEKLAWALRKDLGTV